MKPYDNSKASKYITYLYANDLNGWTMSQYFFYDRFKWLNHKEIW